MKRVITFDALRGMAIFMVLFIHLFFFLLNIDWYAIANPQGMSLPKILLSMLIMYFPAWGGFFLMISSAVHSYVLTKRVEQGYSLSQLLKRQVFTGIVLLAFAMILDILFSPFGFLFNSYIEKRWAYEKIWERIYHIDTIHIIAISIILSSFILSFLYHNNGYGKIAYKKNMTILISMIILIFSLTPFMRNYVSSLSFTWAYTPHPLRPLRIMLASFLKFIAVYIAAGAGEPIFPYFGTALIGTTIGVTVALPVLPKHTLKFMIGSAFLIKLSAIILNYTIDPFFPLARTTFSWYLFCLGGQILMITLFLWLIELGHFTYPMLRSTTFFRRWSMVSLTVFSFQAFTFIPVLFFQFILKWNAFTWHQLSLFQTIIVTIVSIAWWDLIIRLWAKYEFKGSLEWLLLKIYSKKRISSSRSLSVHEIVYQAVPLVFNSNLVHSIPPDLSSHPLTKIKNNS